MTKRQTFGTGLSAGIFAACLGLSASFVTFQASAQFGDGFKPFAQDSCDPLLSGVLTEDGYQNADLGDLYERGYNEDVRQGCGFTRVNEASTFIPQPIQVPVAQSLTELDQDPFSNIVVPEPIDLPDLDLSDEPEPGAAPTGLYARLFGAYASTSRSSGTVNSGGGTSSFTDNVGSGYGVSATVGYALNFDGLFIFNNLRPEVQASYYKFDGSGFSTSAPANTTYTQSNETLIGGFANLVSDIEFGLLPVTPYLGAGVGYGRRDIDYGQNKFQQTGLLYQAMIGGRYGITERLSLDLGYKYLKSFDIDASTSGTNNTFTLDGRNHHIVEGGLTYRF